MILKKSGNDIVPCGVYYEDMVAVQGGRVDNVKAWVPLPSDVHSFLSAFPPSLHPTTRFVNIWNLKKKHILYFWNLK